MNITVAISGGTDSLFALLSLREAGHSVTALHARFLPTPESGDPVPAMRELCSSLGVPLIVADLTQDFRSSVVEPFALEHTLARTPNPCALCNRAMKFGRLLDIALEHGEAFATGHYAALAERTARQLTDSLDNWTAFLDTSARLYKYPYATASAE